MGLHVKFAEPYVTDSSVIQCTDFNRVNYRFVNGVGMGVIMHGEWNFETVFVYILKFARSIWETQIDRN